MPPLGDLLKPKYLVVTVLSFVGFVLMYVATGGSIDLVVWSKEFDLSGMQELLGFIVGTVLLVGAAIYLFRDQLAGGADDITFTQSPFAHFLFNSSASAPIWLGIRLYLGFEWLAAGWHKLDAAAWRNGSALQGYWERAVAVPTPEQAEQGARAAITYDGWRQFLQFMLDNEWYNWFNWVIILGEIAVGVGLIVGAFTGIAAFCGALLNVSFLLSGSVSSNPVLLLLAILVILGWRVAGFIGLDRILMPALGTPWQHNIGGSLAAIKRGQIPDAPPPVSG
ncbi:MAG: DoxX family membrane protein [Thermomicrobiales bacterium]|jgi:thiosulfate dehydrogenase [quinone] large subunit|nr:DoxX family membrane protein [Thermomicrobiales bacterium]